uniref:Uncharacterized protein n=1 Tax=Paramoeba aestuarina TaxID=180227 RepID=A0A7S4KCW3_9EUKA|mmetsp:Transcript_17237/g.26938  ORF Transcript_17237/g.26938 Transcript_17237/m.26938 type:complete len:103 (+) Transcript_17237:88-396(+)
MAQVGANCMSVAIANTTNLRVTFNGVTLAHGESTVYTGTIVTITYGNMDPRTNYTATSYANLNPGTPAMIRYEEGTYNNKLVISGKDSHSGQGFAIEYLPPS